ncbi:stage III sporulation protein AA [Paenibacillus tarimensis]|uniref:stage III sporulation protein AA n=1 Tax=Paenibacillus tarimensis TaxID=416012 RepID=UPI001F46F058|nr:stage III sporulation protein AA [Paenibacillus tarimensis]MCF2942427.1 stage III sporulation protein AA [Paenibacillus tarimensis]
MLNQVKHLLPAEIYQMLGKLPAEVLESLEEIRIREGRPLEIGFAGGYGFTGESGWMGTNPREAYKPSAEACRKLLERITNHSLYAMEEELRRGYITVAGGHRIGLAGRTVLEDGLVRGLRDVSGFNIRIARDLKGVADQLMPKLLDPIKGNLLSALIIAPPMQGKTTMIRDIARSVSYGRWGRSAGREWPARKVGIVDERSEIAACVRGVPTFDVGPRTDVIDACPKAEGMMMMLRSLSPELLIADEIGRMEDGAAIREAAHAGVAVMATAHAANFEDAARRPVLYSLLEDSAFDLLIELRRTAAGTAHRVIPVKGGRGQPGARSPTLPADWSSAAAQIPAAAVKIGRGASP